MGRIVRVLSTLFLFGMGFLNCSTHETQRHPSVEGKWKWSDRENVFSVVFRQSGDSVRGHYCSFFSWGQGISGHVDCGETHAISDSLKPDVDNIFGVITGDQLLMTYTSPYHPAEYGKVIITRRLDTNELLWAVAEPSVPTVPEHAVLTRDTTSH
jgi:hypothetical protein